MRRGQKPTYRTTRQVDADLQDMYRYTRRTWGQAPATRYARPLPQRFRMLAEHLHAGTMREQQFPPMVPLPHTLASTEQFLLVLDSHVRYIPSAYPCLTAPRAQAHPCGMLDGLAPSKDH